MSSAQMDNDLRNMGISFDRFVNLMDAQIVDLARGVSMDLLRELAKGTPVDKGWAKANWIPTLNTPDMTPRPQPAGLTQVANPEGVTMGRSGVIKTMTIKDRICIVNAVPYIVELANGHSQKAPNGWMELVVEKIRVKLAGLQINRRS